MWALNLQMSGPGPAPLGSQVHAAAVNGDRSTLLKLITGNSASMLVLRTHLLPTPNAEGVSGFLYNCFSTILKTGLRISIHDTQ